MKRTLTIRAVRHKGGTWSLYLTHADGSYEHRHGLVDEGHAAQVIDAALRKTRTGRPRVTRREPPETVSMRWCPVCGRDDRSKPFTGKSHFSRGDRCSGQPLVLTYTLKAAA